MAEGNQLRGEGDRFLIAGIRRGDEGAFRQLVQRFGGRLRAYAARRLHGSGVEPDDAVQEAFLGLLQSLDRLDRVRSLQAYLFQILRNKIVDLASKRPEAHGMHRIPLAGEDPHGELHGFEPTADVGTPSSYARREEGIGRRNRILEDVLEEYIGRLQEERNFRDLEALELLFYASWRNRDIARAVGVSEPTVTRIKAAALESLARLVRRHPENDPNAQVTLDDAAAPALIRDVWRQNLLSCVKRSTLGAYVLGTVEGAWRDYVRFHLEVAGCEMCLANIEDLRSESPLMTDEFRERVCTSSVGFLRKNRP